jgi:hypothetical protein
MSQIMQQGIRELLNNGAIELIIFTLIFVLIYGILRKMKFLAPKGGSVDKVKPVHTIIALVMGAMSILPHHYSAWSNYDIVPIVVKSLPQISFVLVGVLCALILLGFFGLKMGGRSGNPLRTFIFFASVVFIIFIFGSNMNWWRNPWSNIFTPDVVAVVIAVLVFALIISFIMGETKPKHKNLKSFLADTGEDKWEKARMNHLMHDYLTGTDEEGKTK